MQSERPVEGTIGWFEGTIGWFRSVVEKKQKICKKASCRRNNAEFTLLTYTRKWPRKHTLLFKTRLIAFTMNISKKIFELNYFLENLQKLSKLHFTEMLIISPRHTGSMAPTQISHSLQGMGVYILLSPGAYLLGRIDNPPHVQKGHQLYSACI